MLTPTPHPAIDKKVPCELCDAESWGNGELEEHMEQNHKNINKTWGVQMAFSVIYIE